MAQKVEITESYLAVDDEGCRHQINIHTTFREFQSTNGIPQWVPGGKAHKMQNGNHVSVSPDGSLEDSVTGKKMRKV